MSEDYDAVQIHKGGKYHILSELLFTGCGRCVKWIEWINVSVVSALDVPPENRCKRRGCVDAWKKAEQGG